MITNALSVDVEEYYHAAVFRMGTKTGAGTNFRSRVEQSIDQLLDLMREGRARATFFVLGEVAAAHPEMVRRIAAEGHEIGCHGDRHDSVDGQTPQEFRSDIRRAKARIEDAVSQPVIGYRAPNFSIGEGQTWAYKILLEEGFRYDSSLYPILHDRYGRPGAPRFPHEIWREGSQGLLEFPIATVRVLGINLPIGGGGYLRLYPLTLTRLGIQHVNTAEERPVMIYLHPWELDPGQPRLAMPWRYRFRHYVGLEKEAAKIAALLDRFRFGTARDVLQGQPHPAARPLSVAPVAAGHPSSL
jgi:polysaccharide deacetylase family protein (PEP-CTERM system associated)